MEGTLKKHIEQLITEARQHLSNVQIHRYDIDEDRALLRLEARWQSYRIFVTVIYRADRTMRYSYHVLDLANHHIHRFDNSADKTAIKLRFADWKHHQNTETPHQHDHVGDITLTEPMTFASFIRWLDTLID